MTKEQLEQASKEMAGILLKYQATEAEAVQIMQGTGEFISFRAYALFPEQFQPEQSEHSAALLQEHR